MVGAQLTDKASIKKAISQNSQWASTQSLPCAKGKAATAPQLRAIASVAFSQENDGRVVIFLFFFIKFR